MPNRPLDRVIRPRFFGVALVALTLVGASAASVAAQMQFRVTYEVDRSNPSRVQVTGVVFNDSPVDVVQVYVTVQALDAAGKVLARGIAFVAPSIPGRGNSEFSARVPVVAGTTSFKVGVSNFRYAPGRGESP